MHVPDEVQSIITKLTTAGFEAYVVGGCVRDLLLKRAPHDWDVATSAVPEEIQKLFPKSFYANPFGTVTVMTNSPEPLLHEIEVTTYRVDATYSDQRHPDAVTFTAKIEEDLSRRDFTVNALALAPWSQNDFTGLNPASKDAVVIDNMRIIDPFGGLKDLNARQIRAVGDAKERFQEDALRLLRAVRLSAELSFTIEEATLAAIKASASAIQAVSQERIRDELVKLVMSNNPEAGFQALEQTGLLAEILPELQEGVGVGQNKHHIYAVFEHNIKSLQFAADYEYPLHIRMAALLHDIGKPRTKRPQGNDFTFYSHDMVGARMAEQLLKRLRFSAEDVKKITHLVRHHMFYYDIGKVTDAGMRRLLRRVGPENFDDLIKLRIAERKGSGVPKARPYRLRHLQFLAEKVSQQPLSVGQLKINGHDLMKDLSMKPGPQIGGILSALLAEVIEDPALNTKKQLMTRAQELMKLDHMELKKRGDEAVETEETKRADDIKRKYHVQ